MRIVVGTDGSPDAAQAIEWLTELPLPADAAVRIVTAVPPPLVDESFATGAWREARRDSESVADDARRRLAKRFQGVVAGVVDDDPRQALVETAAREAADLVVVGTRGLGAAGSFFLGSVSLGVARHAPCAVLVCRGEARPVRSATIALDGSDGARAALRFFAALPLPSDLAVRLVGVVEPLRYPAAAPEMLSATLQAALEGHEAERRGQLEGVLAAAAEALSPRVGVVLTATPSGAPVTAILGEAERAGSDLLVVGARGLGAMKRVLLGSVSESLLRHATCPVLVVRTPA